MNKIKPRGEVMQDLQQYEDNELNCGRIEKNDPPHVRIFYAANGMQSVIDRLDVLCSMIEVGECAPSSEAPRNLPTSRPSLVTVMQETPMQLEAMTKDMHERVERLNRLLFDNV